MKKLVCLLALITLIFSLCSCSFIQGFIPGTGSGEDGGEHSGDNQTTVGSFEAPSAVAVYSVDIDAAGTYI